MSIRIESLPIGLLAATFIGMLLWLHHEKVTSERRREEAGLGRRADQQQAARQRRTSVGWDDRPVMDTTTALSNAR